MHALGSLCNRPRRGGDRHSSERRIDNEEEAATDSVGDASCQRGGLCRTRAWSAARVVRAGVSVVQRSRMTSPLCPAPYAVLGRLLQLRELATLKARVAELERSVGLDDEGRR